MPAVSVLKMSVTQIAINDLRSEIEKGLKQLGFKASVKKIDVQFYKETDEFLGRKRLEKDGTDTTLRIYFSW